MTQKQLLLIAAFGVVAWLVLRPKEAATTDQHGIAVGEPQGFAIIPPSAGQKVAHDEPVIEPRGDGLQVM